MKTTLASKRATTSIFHHQPEDRRKCLNSLADWIGETGILSTWCRTSVAGVARLTEHAGQSRLLLTLTHAAGDLIKSMVANVRKGLDTILATAPQLTKPERWNALVRYIVEKIIAAKPKNHVQPTLMPPNLAQPLIPATG